MSRGEFLRAVAVLAVAAFGFGNLMAALLHHKKHTTNVTQAPQRAGSGFGSRKFGV